MIEAIIEKLLLMRLFGMAEGLQEQKNDAYRDLGFEERLGFLIDKEKLHRQNSQIKSLLSQAHLRHPNACLENIDFRARRGLSKDTILRFAQNDWIRSYQNIIIIGPTGAGKTFLSCALGNSAVRQGIRTLYVRLPRFVQDLRIARADGTYAKLLEKIQRMRLLIVDDWGINPFARRGEEGHPGDHGGQVWGALHHHNDPVPHRHLARHHRRPHPGGRHMRQGHP